MMERATSHMGTLDTIILVTILMGEVNGNNEAMIAKVESGASAILKLSMYPNKIGSITGVMNC